MRGTALEAGRAAAAAVACPLHGRWSDRWRMTAFAVERPDRTGRLVGFGACHGGHAPRESLHRHGHDRLRRWDWECEYRHATVIAIATAAAENDGDEGDEDTSCLGPSIQT